MYTLLVLFELLSFLLSLWFLKLKFNLSLCATLLIWLETFDGFSFQPINRFFLALNSIRYEYPLCVLCNFTDWFFYNFVLSVPEKFS